MLKMPKKRKLKRINVSNHVIFRRTPHNQCIKRSFSFEFDVCYAIFYSIFLAKDLFHKPKSLPDDYCVVRSELSNVEHERAVLPPSSLDLAKFFPSIAKPFPIESVSLKSGLSKNLPPYVRNLCVNLSSSNEDIVTITPTRSKEIKISSEASQDSNDVSIEIKKVKTNVERKFPNFGKNSAVEITLVKPKVSKQNPTTSNPDWEVSVLPKPPPLKKRPLPKIESMSQVLMQKAIEAQQNDLR